MIGFQKTYIFRGEKLPVVEIETVINYAVSVLRSDELGNLFQGSVVSIDTRGCIIEGKTKLIPLPGWRI